MPAGAPFSILGQCPDDLDSWKQLYMWQSREFAQIEAERNVLLVRIDEQKKMLEECADICRIMATQLEHQEILHNMMAMLRCADTSKPTAEVGIQHNGMCPRLLFMTLLN